MQNATKTAQPTPAPAKTERLYKAPRRPLVDGVTQERPVSARTAALRDELAAKRQQTEELRADLAQRRERCAAMRSFLSSIDPVSLTNEEASR